MNASEFAEGMKARGYAIIGTGGNCTGYAKTVNEDKDCAYFLITDGDLSHPEDFPFIMGMCDAHGDYCCEQQVFSFEHLDDMEKQLVFRKEKGVLHYY